MQVLTSNYRLPPMGVNGEKGVFRQLIGADAASVEQGLGTAFRATYEWTLENTRLLVNRMDRFQPDVVYVWNQQGLPKSLLFGLQTMETPLLYDLHSNWLNEDTFESDPWFRWWKRNNGLRSQWYQRFLRLTGSARRHLSHFPLGDLGELDLSHASVCSASLRDELVAAGVSQAATLPVVLPALNTGRLQVKTQFQPVRKFIWAGRLTECKSPTLALEAVKILKARGIDVLLDYYGLGQPSERKAIRDRIDQADLSDRVRMHGIRPGELLPLYREYDALLFTSCCNDPFPITPLEAMLSGLPSIVAKDGGIVEAVEDGETGLLFEAGDAHSLADAMLRMMKLADGGERMARTCLEQLKPQHSLDAVMDRIESLLTAACQT